MRNLRRERSPRFNQVGLGNSRWSHDTYMLLSCTFSRFVIQTYNVTAAALMNSERVED